MPVLTKKKKRFLIVNFQLKIYKFYERCSMNSVNIQMALDGSDFDRLQRFIFEMDPNAKIEVFDEKYFLSDNDLKDLKETIERVKNGTERTYTQDEFYAEMSKHFKNLGA